ncbi:hypothetical protein Ac2012v2_004553 [Leucoagaricus gongylophorus]
MIIKDEISIPEDPPPPYTAFESDPSTHSQFCPLPFESNTKDLPWSSDDIDAVPCCLKEIRARGRKIINSTLLFTGTSLVAAGCAIQGLGKTVIGFGNTFFRA